MHLFDEIDAGGWSDHRDDIRFEPLVTKESIVESARDADFTPEEYAAWRQFEFAGYPQDDDPDGLVEDDAGEDPDPWGWHGGAEPIRVTRWQLESDRDVLRELQRTWRGCYRMSPDGSRSVAGEHPFSTEEGSAEWLQRARIEMRQLYREAKTDQERAAIKAREAALRARHNARCWARAFARYWKLDEGQTLQMLNAWQKSNPIGWLGLEASMRSLFDACWEHYYEERSHWNAYGDNLPVSWMTGEVEQSTRDEWLDSMPSPPEHPTCLVLSAWVDEKGRKHKSPRMEQRPVERVGELGLSGTPAEVAQRRRAEAEAQSEAERRVRLEAHRVRIHRGAVRRWQRETETEWWAARKEHELSGDPTDVRIAYEVPDSDLAAYHAERRRRSQNPEAWKHAA